jgi:hypothetical protein
MHVKYPKTMHLPWSPGLQNDDRLIQSLDGFAGRRVIVTEKMDGENASLYNDHFHARSLDSRHHPSRDWIKAYHARIQAGIPKLWRVCGENLYAVHSIRYTSLPSYFLGFSIWDETNHCLDWDDTLEWFDLLGIHPVPTLFDGTWEEFNEGVARDVATWQVEDQGLEGYVVRIADRFHFDDFQKYVAKYVRKDHIQTDEHWMAGPVIPNGLK